jgi:hypothetical protein
MAAGPTTGQTRTRDSALSRMAQRRRLAVVQGDNGNSRRRDHRCSELSEQGREQAPPVIRGPRGRKFDSQRHDLRVSDDGAAALEIRRGRAIAVAGPQSCSPTGWGLPRRRRPTRRGDSTRRPAHQRRLRSLFLKLHGREVKTLGDGFLVEFASALDAVRSGLAMQRALAATAGAAPTEPRTRVGVRLGDIVESRGDILGDAVKVASRLEGLAGPGGIGRASKSTPMCRTRSKFRSRV